MDFVARIHVDSFASIRRMDYCNAVVCPYFQCSGTVFVKFTGESHTGARARVLGFVARCMFLCAHGQPGPVVQGGIFVDTEHDATLACGVPTSHEGGVKIMRSLFTISYDLYMTRRYPYLMLRQLRNAQLRILFVCTHVDLGGSTASIHPNPCLHLSGLTASNPAIRCTVAGMQVSM